MASKALKDLLLSLPFVLRLDLEGYLASVEAASDGIYEDAGVDRAALPLDDLLIVVAAWRLWTKTDAQHWIVQNTLTLTESHGISSIRTGSVTYSRGSDEVVDLEHFRSELRTWLLRAKLDFVTRARGVVPLLQTYAVMRADGN